MSISKFSRALIFLKYSLRMAVAFLTCSVFGWNSCPKISVKPSGVIASKLMSYADVPSIETCVCII